MTELEKWKNECAELNKKITSLREELHHETVDNAVGNSRKWASHTKDLQESRAANARLRSALEDLRKAFNEVHPSHLITNGCEPCMQDIRARLALETTDGQKELEAVKETARRIEFDDSALFHKLSDAFGLGHVAPVLNDQS